MGHRAANTKWRGRGGVGKWKDKGKGKVNGKGKAEGKAKTLQGMIGGTGFKDKGKPKGREQMSERRPPDQEFSTGRGRPRWGVGRANRILRRARLCWVV